MKKIILTTLLFLTAYSGFSQLATISKQNEQIVGSDTANARLKSIRNSLYLQPNSTTQAASNFTLIAIKKGTDTLNQTGRLQATAALQTINNATLTLIKKGTDTLNQYSRLQATAALQTINNATLTLIKKGTDTLNQYSRLQATAALQTINNATLTLVSKKLDTMLTNQRKLKLVVDSINQSTKIKTVTASITSTNTGTTYDVGGQITGGSLIGYSVSVGTGNWRVVKAIMYPTTSSTALDVNLSVFNQSVTTGADNVVLAGTTSINSRYSGTLHFSVLQPFTGSQVYSSRAATGAGIGDENILVVPVSGVMWFVAWANTAFTPPTDEVYNFKFFLEKVN